MVSGKGNEGKSKEASKAQRPPVHMNDAVTQTVAQAASEAVNPTCINSTSVSIHPIFLTFSITDVEKRYREQHNAQCAVSDVKAARVCLLVFIIALVKVFPQVGGDILPLVYAGFVLYCIVWSLPQTITSVYGPNTYLNCRRKVGLFMRFFDVVAHITVYLLSYPGDLLPLCATDFLGSTLAMPWFYPMLFQDFLLAYGLHALATALSYGSPGGFCLELASPRGVPQLINFMHKVGTMLLYILPGPTELYPYKVTMSQLQCCESLATFWCVGVGYILNGTVLYAMEYQSRKRFAARSVLRLTNVGHWAETVSHHLASVVLMQCFTVWQVVATCMGKLYKPA